MSFEEYTQKFLDHFTTKFNFYLFECICEIPEYKHLLNSSNMYHNLWYILFKVN